MEHLFHVLGIVCYTLAIAYYALRLSDLWRERKDRRR